MRKKLVNSQLTNLLTYNKIKRKMVMLASNVFIFKDIEEKAPYIDIDYINECLIYNGSVAWFYDEVMGLLALPYTVIGKLDLYGRPVTIEVHAKIGNYHRKLNNKEFVIMYDNSGKYPLINDIVQDAERIGQCLRIEDVNVAQQKTSRIWTTDKDKELTVRRLLNDVDGNVENVVAYDSVDVGNLTSVIAVAPYITNDLDEHIKTLWENFYSHIGISSVIIDKKERLIKDEMRASQGGTIASRFVRYNPRAKALKQIKEKFKVDIELEYYDGIPASYEDLEDYEEEREEVIVDE